MIRQSDIHHFHQCAPEMFSKDGVGMSRRCVRRKHVQLHPNNYIRIISEQLYPDNYIRNFQMLMLSLICYGWSPAGCLWLPKEGLVRRVRRVRRVMPHDKPVREARRLQAMPSPVLRLAIGSLPWEMSSLPLFPLSNSRCQRGLLDE